MMALEEYNRKRDFATTPEPRAGRGQARNASLSYVVQKHDATRLHYDLRLELDGVLLSWAVTKEPSLNPADKRLAVRTEDHPLSYGAFEGTIPKGEYGGGTVEIWDKGVWEPRGEPRAGLKKGHLAFTLHGGRLQGGWDLVRMRTEGKRENWLLIRSRDESAANTRGNSVLEGLMRQYPNVQLPTLVERPPEGEQWLHEVKLDGYRLLGFTAGGKARLRTRNGNDWTAKFRTLAAALEKLKVQDAVLDMEAVVVDEKGKSSFQALQSALGERGDQGRIIAFAFDLLHLDGEDLTKRPLTERRKALRALLGRLKSNNTLHFSSDVAGHGGQVFEKACADGWEGIISKRADAPYAAGRQRTWLKSKCGQRQEFIILGYSDARAGGRALGALYLGYRRDGVLHYGGKVGTGFSMASARTLVDRFEPLKVTKPTLTRAEASGLPGSEWESIHWLKPVLLCEVAFAEWTRDGHIRHPSFQGLREDKDPKDVKKETPVAQKTALTLNGVVITHPDRVISETGNVTKGDLAEYYAAVGSFLLKGIRRRPISLLRCPSGIDSNCFYQRSPGKGLGPDVHPFQFRHKGKAYEYLYVEDEKGLLKLVQMGAIEIHPWGAPIDAIDYPDRLIFDLDPSPGIPFEALKLAARDLRERLKANGLESTVKCTGGNGLHVTVALAGKDKWPRVKSFAASLAREMVVDAPEAYVATMSKAKRTGKIFIDYFRNDYTATAIADYSVRARAGAPVAVPLEWGELKGLKASSQFTMQDVLRRLNKKKPPTKPSKSAQTIPT